MDLTYDLMSGMGSNPEKEEHFDFTLSSPSVLLSFWKTDISEPEDPADIRLVMSFNNFTDTGYAVHTQPVDLTEEFPPIPNHEYRGYEYTSGGLQPPGSISQVPGIVQPKTIGNPEQFSFKTYVGPHSVRTIGIHQVESDTPYGPVTKLNDDVYLDMVLVDSAKNNTVSIIFGDETGEYNEADAAPVSPGVVDFEVVRLTGMDYFGLFCLTEKGFVVYAVDGAMQLNPILDSGDVFTDGKRSRSGIVKRPATGFLFRTRTCSKC